jgi:hypothetical protein
MLILKCDVCHQEVDDNEDSTCNLIIQSNPPSIKDRYSTVAKYREIKLERADICKKCVAEIIDYIEDREEYIQTKREKRRGFLCEECFSVIYDEPMWRQPFHTLHGSGYRYFCKLCYPTKEALAYRYLNVWEK